MQKISVLFLFMIASLSANAATTGSASLTNLNVATIFGAGFTISSPNISVYADAYASSDYVNADYQYADAYTLPFGLNITANEGSSSASSSANSATKTLSSSGSVVTGLSTSDAFGYITLDYKANSLLYFSADAAIFGSAEPSSSVFTETWIGLDTYSFAEGFTSTSIKSTFSEGIGIPGSYSISKKLSFYFYDDQDSSIILNAYVKTSLSGDATALPVPEPETYAMLLVGMALLGFVARRKSVT